MSTRPAFRQLILRVALTMLLAIAAVGSTPADDCLPGEFLQSIDPPATRLVSQPAGWSDQAVTPPVNGSIERDENPFDASQCDALFDTYLLESQQFAPGSLTPERPWIAGVPMNRGTLWQRIKSDHHNYYDLQSFKMLAGGFLVGAAVANTQLDQEIQNHFQGSVRGATSDDWFDGLHSSKELGNGRYSLPLFATAWAAGAFFDETPALVTTGRWGERSLRSFLFGAPPMLLAQRLTGGSRPGENDRDSRWLPFQDNNGVSGHAFMSSLPFINAAKMTDRPILKTAFYAASLLGPLSRVNDDDHYPSQVALGWWMAYVAATAIDRTEMAGGNITFYPYTAASGATGGMFEWRF